MTNIDYPSVLRNILPGAEWVISGNDYDTLEMVDDTPKPSQADLDAAWPQVQEVVAWNAVRRERDRLLAASDWSQMPDNALDAPTIAGWAAYRQALRDIPQTQDDPNSIVWPEAP